MKRTKVRYLMSWGPYRKGVVIDHAYEGEVNILLRRGIVELVKEEKPKGKTK